MVLYVHSSYSKVQELFSREILNIDSSQEVLPLQNFQIKYNFSPNKV